MPALDESEVSADSERTLARREKQKRRVQTTSISTHQRSTRAACGLLGLLDTATGL